MTFIAKIKTSCQDKYWKFWAESEEEAEIKVKTRFKNQSFEIRKQ